MASLFGDIDASKADPTVLSLFASSDGPVTKPSKSGHMKSDAGPRSATVSARKQIVGLEEIKDTPDIDGVVSPEVTKSNKKSSKKRKRQHGADVGDDNDIAIAEIEDRYLQKLLDHEDAQPKPGKKSKKSTAEVGIAPDVAEEAATDDDEEEEDHDGDEDQDEGSGDLEDDEDNIAFSSDLVHESLMNEDDEVLKAKRTVFVGNIPSSAISSRSDYATLKKHFAQYGKILSIRFRSIAFAEMLPRKVAFIKQKLHDKRHTVNAYVVYDSEDSARKSLQSNGKLLLDHHMRVDSVAHPAKQDIKRSVFIGNLDFEAEEEALWEHFDKVGDIEYVRIIRDSKTNVGKGFAYVQFKDSVYVARALLLNDKKLGSRKLRVTRARPVRTQKANKKQPLLKSGLPKVDPNTKAQLGRAKKVVGKAERAQLSAAIEGERANQASVPLLKPVRRGKKGKPRIRARSTAFKRNKKQGEDQKRAKS
ncbi:hypothetical protein V1525DRAFT_404413 [Lipomyces kononenkoae]|uniref:Uncharacterized protein n=1 Tax=Lipomyces kononenkoae TaxID=34357 RepID=A0ACC3T0T2_LIPKO